MFINVLFPAPFSPSRQWIRPDSNVRSMWSLARRDPNRLVSPRSSSFMHYSSLQVPRARGGPVRCTSPPPALTTVAARSLGLRLRLRLDRDLAVDDVLLQLA